MGGEIADLDLDSLSWASADEGRAARLALLLDPGWRGARRLCLFLPHAADEDGGGDGDEDLRQRLYRAWMAAAGGGVQV